ncbi:hypothetical protein QEH56_12010 [Pelagicoccus enzymogenes]|uniref:hypothetical protein n=1 Tax=Pelagicoccus enzymogenes TaxID=2773457 RepID=UPI0028105199|nr:hypothetical protein [Pelagicoccus enzymogenes]MDQ8198881.1 hypothetical protein [Pelagicoccus enzymogenes]
MKRLCQWALASICLSLLSSAQADIEFVYLIKEKVHRQFGNEPAAGPVEWGFGAGVSGDAQVSAASVTYPGSDGAVAISGAEGSFDLDQDGFASKEEMDAAYPNGSFSLSVTNQGSPETFGPFAVTGDSYPAAPHLTNVADLEAHDFSQSFELTWASFSDADASSRIILQVWDDANDEEIVFEFLDSSATSFTIPANTFSPDNYYSFDLLFVDETAQLGSPESVIGYLATTTYELSTQTSDTSLGLYKWKRHQQSAQELVEAEGYRPYAFVSEGTREVSYAELNTPAGNYGLVPLGQSLFFLTDSFGTKEVLDAAYPDGEYRFWLNEDGENRSYGTYYFSGDEYPDAPRLTNYNELQSFDATQDQQVSLDIPAGGVDRVDLRLLGGSGTLVWAETLGDGISSATIPADTLVPEENFQIVAIYWSSQFEASKPPAEIGFVSSTYMLGQTASENSSGGGVELAFLIKERVYSQSDNNAATEPIAWSFNAGVQGASDLQGASVSYPGGSEILTGEPGEYESEEHTFASQALLDAAFPDGNYTMSVTVDGTGSDLGPFSISGGNYPVVPQLQNFEELQAHDFSQPFDLSWNSFTGAAADDLVVVQIYDETGDREIVSEFLDATATSYQLPANLLQEDRFYEIELLFLKATDGFGSSEAIVGYLSTTTLYLSTHTSEFSLWLSGYFDSGELQDPNIAGENADPDGDGQDNYFEFLAKFDPSDSSSRLQHRIQDGVIRFWPVNPGVFWEVRFSDDLQAWNPVDQSVYRFDGDAIEFDVDDSSGSAFYRFILLEAPPQD